MANDCLPQVNACRLRVARLAFPGGAPVVGVTNLYVSKALASIGFAWEVAEGQEVVEQNACGEDLVYFRANPNLRRGTITINLMTPDPELSELLSSGVVLTSVGAVGYGAPELGVLADFAVSVEVWTRRIRDGKLDPTFPYGRWAYPYVTKLRPNNHEHNAGNLPMSFVGEAYENDNWGTGPMGDWPVASDRVYQWVPVAELPADQCGYQAIPGP